MRTTILTLFQLAYLFVLQTFSYFFPQYLLPKDSQRTVLEMDRKLKYKKKHFNRII